MTLQERLDEAEAAYHDWTVGNGVRRWVDQNGESLERSPPNMARLTAYIADLRRQITGGSRQGPMGAFI